MSKMLFAFSQKRYKTLNTISVSRKALEKNYYLLQAIHPEAFICPVLKSNAYGHGLTLVAPIFDALHPSFLVVDSLYEAYELSKLRIKTPILILGYTNPENLAIKKLSFHFAVYEETLVDALARHQPHAQVHIFVDTGMSREGVQLAQLKMFVQRIKSNNLKIVGLASHFADADNPKSDMHWKSQLAAFKQALQILREEGVEPQYKHIAASAGSLKMHDPDMNMIRAGLISYGISPLAASDKVKAPSGLQQALCFTSTLVQIKTIPKGTKVGYNGTFTAKKEMKIGIVAAGYYEGVDRRLSNVGMVHIRNVDCPIVGRVSMNMTTIDLTACPNATVGDVVEIYSSNNKAATWLLTQATKAKTIPYELLVHLAATVRRVVTL
jgi:alanine racemase